jgi:peptide/nickel transport system substrate-binding protein
MKSKKLLVAWFLTCLTVLALLLGSCTKPTPTTTTPTIPATPTTQTIPTTSVTPTTPTTPTPTPVEMPKYGGTLTLVMTTDIQGWDNAKYPAGFLLQLYLVYNSGVIGDWAKGPAGTGEIDWDMNALKRIEFTTGDLAESFEIPVPGTFIFHIRHGVHFAVDPNNPASQLVGGREITADDVVYSFKRHLESPMSFLAVSEPIMAQSTTVTKIDDWTVQVQTPLDSVDPMWLLLPEREIVPHEVVETYGDLTDWHNAVGTGPFTVAEYVPGSSVTFVKNQEYWEKDPCGPGKGNQLPYIDAVQMLIMPDVSTQIAALRTGKVDILQNLTHDDAVSLIKTNPELKWHKALGGNMIIGMRTDKQDLPYKDVRVRQALTMAIDFEALKQLDGGDSEVVCFPIADVKGYENAYMPMDQMPDTVKALYSHNVEQAKALLEQAGYKDGFECTIDTWNYPDYIDFLSLVKDMWSKIGVDLTIQPLEFGAYLGESLTNQYKDMIYSFFVEPGPYAQLFAFRGPSCFNRSLISDAHVDEVYQEMVNNDLVNQAKVDQLHRDIMPYLLEQAWYIARPAPYTYTFWQPWVKNYHGEVALGYNASWPKYVWIDQDMKEQMTGIEPTPLPTRKPAPTPTPTPTPTSTTPAEPEVISWQDVAKHLNQTVTVEGPCVGVANYGMFILQIGNTEMSGFGAVISNNILKELPSDIASAFVGKTLKITGKIVDNGFGGTKIDVTDPSQIVIE